MNELFKSSNSPVGGGGEWHIFGKRRSGRENFPFSHRRDVERKRKAERDWTGPHSRKFRIFPYFSATGKSEDFFSLFEAADVSTCPLIKHAESCLPYRPVHLPNSRVQSRDITAESDGIGNFRWRKNWAYRFGGGYGRENENYGFDLWANFDYFYTVR